MTDAGPTEYVIDRDWGPERERLDLLAQWQDPLTIARLEAIGVGQDWDCLEAGAGTGSVARWLRDRVGPTGSVVAADIDTRFLDDLPADVDVRRFDLRTDHFPSASFDLIHVRFVLAHLDDRVALLRKMRDWLRPGGWLLAEEPDCFPALASPNLTWRIFWEATNELRQIDMHTGRLLVPELRAAGYVDLDAEAAVGMVRGGDSSGRFFELTLQAMRPVFVEHRLMEGTVVDELVSGMRDPEFLELGSGRVAAWGRRPPT